VPGRNLLLNLFTVVTFGHAVWENEVDAEGARTDAATDLGEVGADLFGRFASSAIDSDAPGFADRNADVDAVGEAENGVVDAEHARDGGG